jgi:tripartite-type tricarboxylate transporter receptor subunit TctC
MEEAAMTVIEYRPVGRCICRRAGTLGLALAAAANVGAISPAAAQGEVAAFYKGRTFTVVVGSSAGGGVDMYGRLVARHIGRHIPGNPQVIVQNMPGAGSAVAAKHTYAAAPKDGSQMAIVIPGIFVDPLLDPAKATMDVRRFNYIGNASAEVPVCMVRRDAPAKTYADLRSTEIVVGATGHGSTVYDYPIAARLLLGVKIKVVSGYPGTRQISAAIEKGEVHGMCGIGWSSARVQYPQALSGGGVAQVMVQEAVKGYPELDKAGVPLSINLARTEADRKALEVLYSLGSVTRPFLMPPGVPEARVKAVRAAFVAAIADKELQAEARKMRADTDGHTGEEMQKIIADVFATPPEMLARLKQSMSGK